MENQRLFMTALNAALDDAKNDEANEKGRTSE